MLTVDEKLKTKVELLNWAAGHFPSYFGRNWDAFEECIRDFSWVDEGEVILFHKNLPLAENPSDQKLYIEILRSAIEYDRGVDPKLFAWFHPRCMERLSVILMQ